LSVTGAKLPGPVAQIAARSCYLTPGEVRQQPVVLAVAGYLPPEPSWLKTGSFFRRVVIAVRLAIHRE